MSYSSAAAKLPSRPIAPLFRNTPLRRRTPTYVCAHGHNNIPSQPLHPLATPERFCNTRRLVAIFDCPTTAHSSYPLQKLTQVFISCLDFRPCVCILMFTLAFASHFVPVITHTKEDTLRRPPQNRSLTIHTPSLQPKIRYLRGRPHGTVALPEQIPLDQAKRVEKNSCPFCPFRIAPGALAYCRDAVMRQPGSQFQARAKTSRSVGDSPGSKRSRSFTTRRSPGSSQKNASSAT